MERKEFIQKLVGENKTRHEVHGELISQGYSTAGYEDEYAQILKEKGIPEPRPKVAAAIPQEVRGVPSSRTTHIAIPKMIVPLFFLCVLGAVLYGAFVLMSAGDPSMTSEIEWGVEEKKDNEEAGFSVSDFLLKGKVETTAASANVSGGRMGSYEGACNDIIVVAPVECLDTPATFAVFAPLSGGGYYCVDSNEFNGAVSRPTAAVCK